MSVVKQIKINEEKKQLSSSTEVSFESKRREVKEFIDELVKESGYDPDYLDAFLVDAGYLYDTEVLEHEFRMKLNEFSKRFC
ncbi:hypothetical protein F0310_04560 (plasmid) [Borrelia sp. A-FGy1]|uniref:hypothetical protein n=1 Tax=Borrelia sp. A-FGy1 TaxID=2608247 RepID=UPI0015F5F0C0|nr:hypothetical protein [Borrelia sp. A-FGy1]QMU99690.1 hypothetical protein F0310_04560 [Borrelia sp. A-FGy1]